MSRFRLHPLALVLSLCLAACGGGGGDAGGPPPNNPPQGGQPPVNSPPSIQAFEASAALLYIGDTVRLRARFSGGEGRVEPLGLAITSGTDLDVGPLDRSQTLKLVVRRAGQPDAERELPLQVDFRNRYMGIDVQMAISQHAAVPTADGQVLLIGGSRGEGSLSRHIDRYDPRTHSITRIGSLAQGRANPTATRLSSGQVLVAGGAFSGTDWQAAELVDERTGATSPAGRMSVPRTGHGALLLADGKVLVTGGSTTGEGAALGLSRSAELWDPATRAFRRLNAGMLTPRANHSMSLLPDGRVLIVGGYSLEAQPLFAEVFDPRTEQFSSLFVWLRPRAEHAAFTQPDGRVLIVGGEQPQAGREDWVPTASVLRFDPATNAFTELPALAAARSWVRGALLPDGDLLLFGGSQVAAHHSWTAERYHPVRGSVAIANLDGERAQHSVTRLPSGRVAVVGGESRTGNFARSVRIYE